MRTKLRSKVTLLFVMCAVFIAVPVVAALADNVQNDVGGSGITTITAGGSTVVNYRINQNNGDGQTGCNASDGSAATVTINKPAAVTASTSSLTFTSCGTNQPVTFSSNTPGDYNITVSVSDNGSTSTVGTYNTNPANFTLHVNPAPPPANTAPTLTLPGNITKEATGPNGAQVTYNATANDAQDGALTPTCTPASGSTFALGTTQVNCSVKDSGNLTTTGMFSVTVVDSTKPVIAPHADVTADATGPGGANVSYTSPATSDAVDGPGTANCTPASGSQFALGPTTVTCNATDTAGNQATPTTFKVTVSDATPPVITHDIQGTLGNNGWYTSDVDLTWSVTDPESPNSIVKTGCAAQHITSDQGPTTYSCSATSAGGPAGPETVSIKRDGTAPDVTLGAASGTNGNNGWYKSAVTQTFNASDATSGLADPNQDPSFTKSSGTNEEGQNVNIPSGPVSDNAGNTASASAGPFKIDLSNPEADCDDAPTAWSQNDVNIHCQASDAVSGLADSADGDFDLSTSVPNGTETANASTGHRVVADAAGRTVTAGPISGIKVDKKAPVLTDEGPTTTPNGDGGWYTSAVTNGFKATDGGSGFAPSGNLTKSFTESSGTNEGAAVKIASGAVSDAVGNSTLSINSVEFKIDLSNPTNVRFSGGPDADGSYFFGDTPDKPTCAADDNVSGFASCEVTGYSTAVSAPGTHTMTATAKDNAGRTATTTRSYTVKAWTTKGFYQPVDMNGVYNTVKGGSTVPLKFELFAASELTSTSAVKSLQSQKIACDGTHPEDAIEATATGGTSLRYDSTGGQFIYNWKTPTGAGSCHKVTLTANDGSTIIAYFKMK